MAAFNLHPSTRGSELDGIGSSAIQVLDHAPLHRTPVRRVTQGADQRLGRDVYDRYDELAAQLAGLKAELDAIVTADLPSLRPLP